MIFTRKRMMGVGLVLAAALCVFCPKSVRAEGIAYEMDGVMGQSLREEQNNDLDRLILKGAGLDAVPALLSATSSYTDSFLESSFTTEGIYTSATYYHKVEYEDYKLFHGIDVSWWQGGGKNSSTTKLDWKKVHDAGIDFAFVRVASRDSSDGSLYEDTCASAHIKAATENDINVGLYVFSQALTEAEAKEEAQYVLKLVKKYDWDVTMPIVIDREGGSYKRLTAGKLSKSKETAVVQAFADTITKAGYAACVYASYDWIYHYVDTDALKNCTVWIARYNYTTTSKTTSGEAFSDVPYDYEYWQYSSVAKVDGYSGNLDANFWYKDTTVKTKNLKMTANTANSVTLSWSAASDAPKYRIYRYDEEQDKYVYLATTKKTSYTDSDLEAGTDYQYKVRGFWTIGGKNYFGSYSAVLSVTTLPGKVKDVTVEKRTTTTLTLGWSAVKRATGYRVYQYNEDTGSYKKIADVPAEETSYRVTELLGASEYAFKVRAYKTVDGTKYWGSKSAECATFTKPASIKEVKAVTESATAVKLSWSKVARATGYLIYRWNAASESYEKIANVKNASTLSYTDSGLASAKEYIYQVRAYKNDAGTNYYGGYSAEAAAITKPAKTNQLNLSTKSSSVTLTWKKVSRATGYQIYRLNTKTGKYEKLTTVKGASKCTYKNTKLTKAKSYTYKVRAYKTYEGKTYVGGYSSAVKITVK